MSSGGRKTIEMEQSEQRFAWLLVLPVLGTIMLIAFFPLLWTVWDSFHVHDLRMPWLGRPFVGAANYAKRCRTSAWGGRSCTPCFSLR